MSRRRIDADPTARYDQEPRSSAPLGIRRSSLARAVRRSMKPLTMADGAASRTKKVSELVSDLRTHVFEMRQKVRDATPYRHHAVVTT